MSVACLYVIKLSRDKKLQIFTSIFHPVLLHFFEFLYNDLIPLSNVSFDHKRNY